jgi:hypothetical protein
MDYACGVAFGSERACPRIWCLTERCGAALDDVRRLAGSLLPPSTRTELAMVAFVLLACLAARVVAERRRATYCLLVVAALVTPRCAYLLDKLEDAAYDNVTEAAREHAAAAALLVAMAMAFGCARAQRSQPGRVSDRCLLCSALLLAALALPKAALAVALLGGVAADARAIAARSLCSRQQPALAGLRGEPLVMGEWAMSEEEYFQIIPCHGAAADQRVCLLFKDDVFVDRWIGALSSSDGLHFEGKPWLVMPRGQGGAIMMHNCARGAVRTRDTLLPPATRRALGCRRRLGSQLRPHQMPRCATTARSS